jgi:hypothetical protein
MKTNSMHYLALIYFFKQPLHVSGVFIAHHHEVKVKVKQPITGLDRPCGFQEVEAPRF